MFRKLVWARNLRTKKQPGNFSRRNSKRNIRRKEWPKLKENLEGRSGVFFFWCGKLKECSTSCLSWYAGYIVSKNNSAHPSYMDFSQGFVPVPIVTRNPNANNQLLVLSILDNVWNRFRKRLFCCYLAAHFCDRTSQGNSAVLGNLRFFTHLHIVRFSNYIGN